MGRRRQQAVAIKQGAVEALPRPVTRVRRRCRYCESEYCIVTYGKAEQVPLLCKACEAEERQREGLY